MSRAHAFFEAHAPAAPVKTGRQAASELWLGAKGLALTEQRIAEMRRQHAGRLVKAPAAACFRCRRFLPFRVGACPGVPVPASRPQSVPVCHESFLTPPAERSARRPGVRR